MIFSFSRSFGLHRIFPQSAGGPNLNPSEIETTVQLTHPVMSPASLLEQAAGFQITGPAAASADTSETPAGRVIYYPHIRCYHNDPVARVCSLIVREVNTAQDVEVWTSLVGGPGRLAPAGIAGGNLSANVAVPFADLYTPPGFLLRFLVSGLAAGQVAHIDGVALVLDVSELPPPRC